MNKFVDFVIKSFEKYGVIYILFTFSKEIINLTSKGVNIIVKKKFLLS